VFALGVLSKIRRPIIRSLIEVLDTVGVGTPRRSTSSRCAGMQKLRDLESPRLAPLLNQWLALLRHERDVLHSISVSHLASSGLRQASIRYFPIELKKSAIRLQRLGDPDRSQGRWRCNSDFAVSDGVNQSRRSLPAPTCETSAEELEEVPHRQTSFNRFGRSFRRRRSAAGLTDENINNK
jgi:hypothetical protein